MPDLRPAVVAGIFYPDEPTELAEAVRAYLALAALPWARTRGWPKALIVPHAGYIYSGATAGAAYASIAAGRSVIRRVVLLGPAHRAAVRGLAVPTAGAFATPLGTVPLDLEAAAAALSFAQVRQSDVAHAQEHALEVQLPFLQTLLDEFKVLPLLVGDARPHDVAAVIERLWGGPETLLVVSSDLSHYHGYAQAQQRDQDTVESVLELDPEIGHEQACGATPINGLLLCAREHALRPVLLNCCNSGDTAGDRSRVVGYASFAFLESAPLGAR